MMDKLDEIIQLQKALMDRLGVVSFDPHFRDERQLMDETEHSPVALTVQQQTRDLLLAVCCELGEIGDEINWKPWKRTHKQIDLDLLYTELIDVLHFILEIMIMWGMDADHIRAYYVVKNKINHERQEAGY